MMKPEPSEPASRVRGWAPFAPLPLLPQSHCFHCRSRAALLLSPCWLGSNWRKNCSNGSCCCFTGTRCLVEILTTAGCSFATRSAKDIGAPARGASADVPGAFCANLSARLPRCQGKRRSPEKQGHRDPIGVAHFSGLLRPHRYSINPGGTQGANVAAALTPFERMRVRQKLFAPLRPENSFR